MGVDGSSWKSVRVCVIKTKSATTFPTTTPGRELCLLCWITCWIDDSHTTFFFYAMVSSCLSFTISPLYSWLSLLIQNANSLIATATRRKRKFPTRWGTGGWNVHQYKCQWLFRHCNVRKEREASLMLFTLRATKCAFFLWYIYILSSDVVWERKSVGDDDMHMEC